MRYLFLLSRETFRATVTLCFASCLHFLFFLFPFVDNTRVLWYMIIPRGGENRKQNLKPVRGKREEGRAKMRLCALR